MDQKKNEQRQAELQPWIKKNLDNAVQKLIKRGAIDSLVVEARPAWVLPFQIVIGKIRAKDQPEDFEWFICGEVPIDYVASAVSDSPRETAKHFAMKWQLTAARFQKNINENSPNPEALKLQTAAIQNLIAQSEALYELVDDDRVWVQ